MTKDEIQKHIELLDAMITEASEVKKYVETKETEYYNKKFEGIRNRIFKHSYDIRTEIDRLQRDRDLFSTILSDNISVDDIVIYEGYGLKIYLSYDERSAISAYCYIDGGGWIYENYISSWSGMNEWITDMISEKAALYTGNSGYSHAFGTYELKYALNNLGKSETKNDEKIKIIKWINSLLTYDKLIEQLKKDFDLMFGFMKENAEE